MTMQKEYILKSASLEETDAVAATLLNHYPEKKIFLLHGDLGAGKTTLVQAFCRHLGVRDQAKSPSFSIVNEYAGKSGPVYHFDFYRLNDESEAAELGLEEYWDSGHPCFVEWPENIPSWLPVEYLDIRIETDDDGVRSFFIHPHFSAV